MYCGSSNLFNNAFLEPTFKTLNLLPKAYKELKVLPSCIWPNKYSFNLESVSALFNSAAGCARIANLLLKISGTSVFIFSLT